MEYVGLLVFVFIVAVIANIVMGIMDIRMKKEMYDMVDDMAQGFFEGMQEGQQQGQQEVPTIALTQEHIQAIAKLVADILKEDNKKE